MAVRFKQEAGLATTKPKRKRKTRKRSPPEAPRPEDEPISLYPLSTEDALEAALKTKWPPENAPE